MKKLPIIIISIFLLLIGVISYVVITLLPLKPFLPHLNYLLGSNKPTSYLILLQNDREMRANGGFAGSYAKITLNYPKHEVDFQDIYVPNGQLKGYVTPPQPIQDAFQHGTWELANADWEPDFPTAAKSIRWFFEKGGEVNPDILATLSLSTIKDILHIVGPFKVSEYDAEITPDNFYLFLQGKAEVDFFPGSTQKKDTLTSVGTSLKKKLFSLSPPQYLSIAKIIIRDLKRQNILLNSNDKNFQSFLDQNSYSGRLTQGPLDTYMLVETNLGANKANCCIERNTVHHISKGNNSYHHQVNLTLNNLSSEANPNPPFSYSGHYVAYLRFLIPKDAYDIFVEPKQSSPSSGLVGFFTNQINIHDNLGFKEIGFFHITSAGTKSTVDLTYNTATGSALFPYQIRILKQHGLISSPNTLNYTDKTISTELFEPFEFQSEQE